jgi:hypothetical protein
MLNFKFFNKSNTEEVNVKVESDDKSINTIKLQASKDCIERYNQSVINNIKEKLLFQYQINDNNYLPMAFAKERNLVDAICKDIANEMGLFKDE